MELGMIGLGKMGGNMAQRLLLGGHQVTVYDTSEMAVEIVTQHGARRASSVEDLVKQLSTPKSVWIMVPSGQPTEDVISNLVNLLACGDTIIDGGNTNYKDTIRRASELQAFGISLLDAGTSGGVWGLKEGYSMMIGGDTQAFQKLEPLFQTLAPEHDKGYGHVGPAGSGHFAKMIHNGIEYGLMQAYAEGFELIKAKGDLKLDVKQIAEIWRHGSVIRSWLLDLITDALCKNPDMTDIQGYVDDSGEGRWTVQESIDLSVPIPVITASLQQRFRSRQEDPFGSKLLAALRAQFGGHPVKLNSSANSKMNTDTMYPTK